MESDVESVLSGQDRLKRILEIRRELDLGVYSVSTDRLVNALLREVIHADPTQVEQDEGERFPLVPPELDN